MTEANELARHLINRNAALRMSEDLKMPEILEAYDRHMERQRIDQAQTAFAKDIARQCVSIDIRQKSLAKDTQNRVKVYTARQLRDAGIEVGKDVPDHTKFTLSKSSRTMKTLTATLSTIALLACSPESILTPDDCKVERVRKETTFTIGDTLSSESNYQVTMAGGKVLYITEAEALAAQADPVAACQELRGRE